MPWYKDSDIYFKGCGDSLAYRSFMLKYHHKYSDNDS